MSPQPLCLLLSGPRIGTSSSQPRFIDWLCLGILKPSTGSSHLRLLCSSCWVALGRTQMLADPGLHHLRNPRACTPNKQLQTTLEHHHPASAQLILQRGWRLVVSSHSQSSQLTGLGKSLPLTSQQSRLSYKRRLYSSHTKGSCPVPSLGDRGGCTTDTIGHLLY